LKPLFERKSLSNISKQFVKASTKHQEAGMTQQVKKLKKLHSPNVLDYHHGYAFFGNFC